MPSARLFVCPSVDCSLSSIRCWLTSFCLFEALTMTISVPHWSQFGSGSVCCWYGRVRMCYSDGQGPPPALVSVGSSSSDGVGLGHGRRAAPALAVRVGAVGLGSRNSMEGAGGSDASAAGNGAAVSCAEEETTRKKNLQDSVTGGGPDHHHHLVMSTTVGMSTNIVWHECAVGNLERQKLIGQKGCVIWITGLSGSGKSTVACALSRELHSRGFLTYVLDGDNVRHGLNRDLCFKQEDRAENIRRIGEVAKLFADAGIICIASLISPYRRDREACRAILPDGAFIEVFMDIPLEICEARDPKGLYKLARAGKIKGFTGIDDPYEPPLDCEIKLQHRASFIPSPTAMADQVVSYLDSNGFLEG